MFDTSSRRNSERAGILEQPKSVCLRSFKGNDWYSISIDQKTCDCPNFDTKANGCEHLAALGYDASSKRPESVAKPPAPI